MKERKKEVLSTGLSTMYSVPCQPQAAVASTCHVAAQTLLPLYSAINPSGATHAYTGDYCTAHTPTQRRSHNMQVCHLLLCCTSVQQVLQFPLQPAANCPVQRY
jgi:hypothetical protein